MLQLKNICVFIQPKAGISNNIIVDTLALATKGEFVHNI